MNSLSELYSSHQGKVSDKWSLYVSTYDRLFGPYRDKPVHLLEVGVQNGGSLEIWSQYFSQAQKLIGCDINTDCAELQYDDPRIAIVVGDANSNRTEEQIAKHAATFDIVIDDGSHRSSDIIKTFVRYFPRVVDGGLFVAEDLHCSYWQEFEGGLHNPYASMSFFKLLADVINHEHWGIEKERSDLLKGIAEHYLLIIDDELLSSINSIEFVNSVCIIRKQSRQDNELGTRIVAGNEASVWSDAQQVAGQRLVSPNQSINRWAKQGRPSGEMILHYEERLAERDGQIADLNQAVTARDGQIANLNQAVTQRDGQIANLNQAVTQRDGQIANLNQAVTALHSSTSWRLTKPLRFVGHQIFRAKHLIKIVPSGLRMGGGARATLKKAINFYRREGLSGLKRRLDFVQTGGAVNPAVGSDGFGRNDYASWYETREPRPEAYPEIRRATEGWKARPEIAVVVPVYNTPEGFLVAAIESVLAQVYPHWQLSICDDASTRPHVREVLKRYAKRDSRISVVTLNNNGGIAVATNEAISVVTADYLAFLDHDDVLHPLALHHIAEAIVANEDADIWYSDEDKLDYNGQRCMPLFKPDWSPHLALSQAYLGHLVCYRTSMLREVGRCRTDCDGAQDYDMWLRASLKARRIVHVPKVLYHWRMHAESTAATPDSKPYAHEAGRRALQDYVRVRYPQALIEVADGEYTFTYALKFRLPDDLKVSIIIPTRNRVDLLRPCVDSILAKSNWQNFEILVLDNGSDDPETLAWMHEISRRDARVRVIPADIPFNWSRLNNIGAAEATGTVLVFLNNDTVVISPDWLEKLAGFALLPDVGMVGALLLFDDGTIQHSGVVVGMGGWADHVYRTNPATHLCGTFISPVLTRNALAVTGACAAISAERFHEVGGFDEEFIVCGSDVEICLRTHERGWHNVVVGEVRLFHFESKSRDPAKVPPNDFEQSARKYEPFRTMRVDPYFNPNLSLMTTTPTLEAGSMAACVT
jgi:GT2 family glycosyltransferase